MTNDRFTITEELITDEQWASGKWRKGLEWSDPESVYTNDWKTRGDERDRWSVINPDNYHYSVVIDGRTYPADNGVESVTFSPDGKRFVLVTSYLERQPECFYRVYLDGVLSGPELCMPSILWEMEDEYVGWDQPERHCPPPPEPRFSADSKYVVWVGYADDWLESMVAVVDGVAGPVCRKIRNLFFTSDGRAVWEAVLKNGAEVVVIDLDTSREWDAVSLVHEDSNGEVSFWGRQGDKYWFVSGHDGWGPCDEVRPNECRDADGRAFVALRGSWSELRNGEWGWEVNVDGMGDEWGERACYNPFTERVENEVDIPDEDGSYPLGCADGEAYRWRVLGLAPGGEWFVVANGQARGPYDGVLENSLRLGPNGEVAFVANRGGNSIVVVNGTEIAPRNSTDRAWGCCAPGGRFLRDERFLFLARRGDRRLLVTATPLE